LKNSENIADNINHYMHQILYTKYTDGWGWSSKLSYLTPKFLGNMTLPQQLKNGVLMTSSQHLNPLTLCNGTSEGVKQLYNFVTEAAVITGHTARWNVFTWRIHRVPMDYTFKFKRLMFPVRLSFAMGV
jgi:hypothetical protein